MGYYATPCVAYGKKPEFYYADLWDLMTANEKGKHALAPVTPSVFFDKLYWGLIDSSKWQPNNPSTPPKPSCFLFSCFFFCALANFLNFTGLLQHWEPHFEISKAFVSLRLMLMSTHLSNESELIWHVFRLRYHAKTSGYRRPTKLKRSDCLV